MEACRASGDHGEAQSMSAADDEYREKVQGRKCSKAECWSAATILVKFSDPDGALEWPSCFYHAEQFKEWMFRESEIQGASAASQFESSDGRTVIVNLFYP
jgi:hypothetical protein